jgi:hypothetical protein
MWGGVLTVTGFAACPCHLPFSLPILLSILGGTGVGAFIGANSGLIYGLFTGYFVAGVAGGVFLLNRKRSVADGDACELPARRRVRIVRPKDPGKARIHRTRN